MTRSATDRSDFPATRWRNAGLVLAALLTAVLWLYASTAAEAVHVWQRSETHAFSFLILPISGYFVWLRLAAVARMTPRPWPAAALLAVPAALAWLAGELAQAAVLAQFGLVALLQVAVLAVLGWPIYRALLFPLQLLWLLVPFGESLLPTMIDLTVLQTTAGLWLLGMQVEIEGNILGTEAGHFAVVEACSALDFLIGNAVISLVYANLMYTGWRKRALYVLAGAPVAVLANGVRTTSVIYLTYLSGGELNLAADHKTFGWLLFCVAVALQMAIGWRYRDPPAPAVVPTVEPTLPPPVRRLLFAGGIVLAAAAVAPGLAALVFAGQPAAAPVTLCPPPGLGPAGEPGDWRPPFGGADGMLAARYTVDGRAVDLFAGYYGGVGPGREMVTWRNRLDQIAGWKRLAVGSVPARIDGEVRPVNRIWLRGPDKARRLAWQIYWVDGRAATADWMTKLLRVTSALTGDGSGASIIVTTDGAGGEAAAAAALQALLDRAAVVAPLLQAARSGAGC